MTKHPKQLREKPCPQRFLAAEEKSLSTGTEAKNRGRFLNGKPQEIDRFQNFSSGVGTVEERIVELDVLEDSAAVHVNEHVVVLDSFA